MKDKGTTIRISKATRKKLKHALLDSPHRSYDEWINKKLDEEKPSKQPNQ